MVNRAAIKKIVTLQELFATAKGRECRNMQECMIEVAYEMNCLENGIPYVPRHPVPPAVEQWMAERLRENDEKTQRRTGETPRISDHSDDEVR